MSLVGGYWNYTITKIEIIISDIYDYEIIKVYLDNEDVEESRIKQGQGIKFVYNTILKDYVAIEDRKLPEVWVHDIKTRILKYRIE